MADVTLGNERTVKVITPAIPTLKATRPTPPGPILVVPVAGPAGAAGGISSSDVLALLEPQVDLVVLLDNIMEAGA